MTEITITGKLGNIYSFTGDYNLRKGDKVYTEPQQRTWVGLTDVERLGIRSRVQGYISIDNVKYGEAIQYATEQALMEKNA